MTRALELAVALFLLAAVLALYGAVGEQPWGM